MSETAETDVAVIGAGPVGLFAVFQCGMLRLRCHVFDALEMVGGQCSALYPEKPIFDIPAYPRIEAQALVDRLAEQAAPFAPVYHLAAQAMALTPCPDGGFEIGTASGTQVRAGAVLIAGGVGAFGPNRPPLAGIEGYEGQAVFYLVRQREAFRDRRIVIAGGGDSAVDWAISLAELARHVMLVHRRNKFRAAPESLARLEELVGAGRVELVVPYQLHGLSGDGRALDAVIVADLEGRTRRLDADRLLPFFGLSMQLGPIAAWGLDMQQGHIAIDPATAATSTPGIYAAGDIATYPRKLKLILTGFAEAAQAAQAIRQRLRPDEALHFQYSTTTGVPAAT